MTISKSLNRTTRLTTRTLKTSLSQLISQSRHSTSLSRQIRTRMAPSMAVGRVFCRVTRTGVSTRPPRSIEAAYHHHWIQLDPQERPWVTPQDGTKPQRSEEEALCHQAHTDANITHTAEDPFKPDGTIGFCVDIGAPRSVVSGVELTRLLNHLGRSRKKFKPPDNTFLFGDEVFESLGTIVLLMQNPKQVDPIPVKMDVVRCKIPAMLAIDAMDENSLAQCIVTNTLVKQVVKEKGPVDLGPSRPCTQIATTFLPCCRWPSWHASPASNSKCSIGSSSIRALTSCSTWSKGLDLNTIRRKYAKH